MGQALPSLLLDVPGMREPGTVPSLRDHADAVTSGTDSAAGTAGGIAPFARRLHHSADVHERP
jgi:hypothetical protein